MSVLSKLNLTAFGLLSLAGGPGNRYNIRFDRPDGDGDAGGGGGGGGGGTPNPKPGDKAPEPNAELEAARAEAAAAKAEAERTAKELAEFKKSAPSAADKAELARLKQEKEAAEAKRLKDEGQFEKLLADADKKAADRIAEIEKDRDTIKSKYHASKIDAVVSNETPKHSDIDSRILFKSLFADFLRVDDKTGEVVVRDADGNPIRGPKGKDLTPAEFIEAEISKNDWAKRAKVKGGSGGARGEPGKAPGSGGDLTDEQIAGMTHEETMALIGRGK